MSDFPFSEAVWARSWKLVRQKIAIRTSVDAILLKLPEAREDDFVGLYASVMFLAFVVRGAILVSVFKLTSLWSWVGATA